MLNDVLSAVAGLLCGILSGFGIGGGSLLMVWMTAALSMQQTQAQGINLLYFLPTAVLALVFHAKNRQIVWQAVWPAVLAGLCSAAAGAILAQHVPDTLLRRLFGCFLILVGAEEIFFRSKKADSSDR